MFDGSPERVAGFLINVRISVPLLESDSSSLQLDADVAWYPWLLVGICACTIQIPGVDMWNNNNFINEHAKCNHVCQICKLKTLYVKSIVCVCMSVPNLANKQRAVNGSVVHQSEP